MTTRQSKRLPAPYPLSRDSPFADGYDIQSEATTLAHLIEADEPDMDDPLYPRFLEYCTRVEQLQKAQTRRRLRDYAEEVVPDHEAAGMKQIGTLVGDGVDTMSLHTREAYRLFIGRSGDENRGHGEISGKKCGAVLRSIWMLSATDNPYADLVLIQTTERIEKVRRVLEAEIAAKTRTLDQIQQRGLKLSVMRSQRPLDVELGFRSPYGYMVAELILDFDYYARMIKTLMVKSQMTDTEGRAALFGLGRQIRSIFEQLIPLQKRLLDERLKSLCRGDWASTDETARKRVQAATALFGELPRDIFAGDRLPRHTKRRVDLSPAERELLQTMPLKPEAGTDEEQELL